MATGLGYAMHKWFLFKAWMAKLPPNENPVAYLMGAINDAPLT